MPGVGRRNSLQGSRLWTSERAGVLLLTLVLVYLLGFFAYQTFVAHDRSPSVAQPESKGETRQHTWLALLFAPGPVQWILTLTAGSLSVWLVSRDWRRRRGKRQGVGTEHRIMRRELVEALHNAPSPERAFHGYAFLRAEFRDDETTQEELHHAFRRDWMPYLRQQLGRYLHAGRFDEAEEFLEEMQWEWREGTSEEILNAMRHLIQHLRGPQATPPREVLQQVLEGFRGAGLEATAAVLKWLAETEPDLDLVEEVLFRDGGAGGHYLLRRWAERNEKVRGQLRKWEKGATPPSRRAEGICALWPRGRGESQVLQQGVHRLELDFNPFGPEKAEQDPLLPDLFYHLSPVWEEIAAPQPSVVIAPPGCGRSAFIWMLRYESALIGSALEQVFPVYVPLHAFHSPGELAQILQTLIAAAWSCILARDPYALLGLEEAEQRVLFELFFQAAGGLTPFLRQLHSAGLISQDPDGQLLQEVFGAAARSWETAERNALGLQASDSAHVQRFYPEQHNVNAIRSLIRDAFTARELERFCQERPAFRPILDDLGRGPSLNDILYLLVEHCEKRRLFPELLAEIRALNPNQFARHQARLYEAHWSVEDGPPRWSSQGILPGRLSPPYGMEYTFLLVDVSFQDGHMASVLLESLFERWLPSLAPCHVIPKVFLLSEPDECPVTPIWIKWSELELRRLLRHRLERAGLVLQGDQAVLDGWVEGLEDPDRFLVGEAGGSPAQLIRLGNRMIRRLAQPQLLMQDEFLSILSQQGNAPGI